LICWSFYQRHQDLFLHPFVLRHCFKAPCQYKHFLFYAVYSSVWRDLDHLCPYWKLFFLMGIFSIYAHYFSGTKVGRKTRTWCTVFTLPYLTSGLYVRSYKPHIYNCTSVFNRPVQAQVQSLPRQIKTQFTCFSCRKPYPALRVDVLLNKSRNSSPTLGRRCTTRGPQFWWSCKFCSPVGWLAI
jgi:hypothetical protein